MNSRKRNRIAGLLLVLVAAAGPAWAEQIELITYYPAPGGGASTFDRAHSNRHTVGDAYNRNNAPDANVPDGNLFVSQRVAIGPGFNAAAPARRLHVFVPDTGPGGNGDGIQIAGVMPGLFLVGQASPAGGTAAQRGGFGMASAANQYGVGTVAGDVTLFSQVGKLHLASTPNEGANPTVRMTVDTAGNVGIGTTNPATSLHVNGPGGWGIQATSPGLTRAAILGTNNGGNAAFVKVSQDPTQAARTWDLAVYPDNRFTIVQPGGIDRVTVLPTGNVGIGTAAPAYRLDVRTGAGGAVYGNTTAANQYAGYFQGATYGVGGTGGSYGLYGSSTSGYGLYGTSSTGWAGVSSGTNFGHYANGRYHGLFAQATYYALFGHSTYFGLLALATYYPILAMNTSSGTWSYIAYSNYGLYTNGGVGAAWWQPTSSIEAKKDVTPLSQHQEASILASIEKLPLVHFHFKNDPASFGQRLGVIAEWSPREIKPYDDKSIDATSYITYTLAGVKALAQQAKEQDGVIRRQEEEIRKLKERLDRLEPKEAANR